MCTCVCLGCEQVLELTECLLLNLELPICQDLLASELSGSLSLPPQPWDYRGSSPDFYVGSGV